MAVPTNPGQANALAQAAPAGQEHGAEPQFDARQLRLHWLYSFYATRQYNGRQYDWDGRKAAVHVEHEQIATQQQIPPGFCDVSAQASEVPLKFRRPTAPYHLVRCVVNKFSGLLFSAKRCPRIVVPDDAQTEEWLAGYALDANLWGRLKMGRALGGSMGAVGLGPRFAKDGKPVIEVHDPRWTTVEYTDRDTGVVKKLETKYAYQADIPDKMRGRKVKGWFYYRRVIDEQKDQIWLRVPIEQVTDGEDPSWEKFDSETREHKYGFCPVVWIQNLPNSEGIDGWTDVEGVHELQHAIDQLMSQAHKGTVKNADPTTVLRSDAVDETGGTLRKGSDHGVQVEAGGGLEYLEMSGGGIETALKLVDRYRDMALEVARCVLDANFDGPARTEEETEANYSSMVEAADDLRMQYGEGCKKLLEMVLSIARRGSKPRSVQDADKVRVLRTHIKLTPRVLELDDGTKVRAPRVLGDGEIVELHWPEYRQHSLEDLGKVVEGTTKAVQASIIDRETAGRKVAPYFDVRDVKKMMSKADEEQAQQVKQMQDEIALRGAGGGEHSDAAE